MERINVTDKQVILEQKKEIARLQKAYAKLEVKCHSQIEALKAQLAEEKKNKVVIEISKEEAEL